jgi:hypothetical protein
VAAEQQVRTTNEQIRLSRERAIRLLAERLRTAGTSPADANSLAGTITAGLIAATPASRKPGLDAWRMIPPEPSGHALSKLTHLKDDLLREQLGQDIFSHTLWRLWKIVYDEGSELPEDVGLTDT